MPTILNQGCVPLGLLVRSLVVLGLWLPGIGLIEQNNLNTWDWKSLLSPHPSLRIRPPSTPSPPAPLPLSVLLPPSLLLFPFFPFLPLTPSSLRQRKQGLMCSESPLSRALRLISFSYLSFSPRSSSFPPSSHLRVWIIGLFAPSRHGFPLRFYLFFPFLPS